MNGPRLHVGTYAKTGGAGLQELVPTTAGGWALGSADPVAPNASFGCRSARTGLLYLADECDAGAVGVYRYTADGWKVIARVPSGGALPCYLALDAEERHLAVANYGSGSVALFRLDDAGLPLGPPAVRTASGRGPVADRQKGPHAHCVCFSRGASCLYHVDLGVDRVFAYPVESGSGMLGEATIAYAAPPGSGPRHIVLHPVLPLALLASELASTRTVLQTSGDTFVARQTLSTLPADYAGQSLAGHLSLNSAGDRVYVTNRGHDSVAVFAWDASGILQPLQHVASGGASPRAFVLLEEERQLILANEGDGTLTLFDLAADGTLEYRDTLPLPGAAFPFVTK